MAGISLQFQGVRNAGLVIALVAAVAAALAVFGIVQLLRRRWREGIVCLAGAMSPVTIGLVLAVDGGLRYAAGNRRAGRGSLLGAAVALCGSAAAGLFIAGAADRSGAFWMSALGLEVAVAVGVFYAAVYAYLGTQRLTVLMLLRCLAILSLLLILFRPALSIAPEADQSKPDLPILLDRSASMATADVGNVRDRYVEAVQMLNSQQPALERSFQPVWYHFAQQPQMVQNLAALAALQPAGEGTDGTNIAAAIRTAVQRGGPGGLPGIVLLTDGLHNGSDNLLDAVVEAGVPIYVLAVGSTSENVAGRRNVQLVSVDAPMEAVKNNVTTIGARLQITALQNVSTEVQLWEEGSSQPVASQSVWTDKVSQAVTVELKWTPRDRGAGTGPATRETEGPAKEPRSEVCRLRLGAAANPAETVTQDNDTELHVLVTEPRVRVLYVEGSMRPEYKFLRRLLDSDANLQFMGLIRVSGNRFLCQGSIGGRQLEALPASDEDFALFDVIILGDLDRTFVTAEQLSRLRRFVNDGGGLLMLGGHNSFGPGGYGETDLEEALPVVMGARAQPQETTPFVPMLTAQGEAHPILEGIAGYFGGPGGRKPDEKLQKLPELLGCVTVATAKPGAAVLAVHPARRNETGPLVVLAVQNFGAGRSAAFTADTTWQWYLPLRGMGAQSPYERFWGQLCRWLANVETKTRDTASAVVLRLDRSYLLAGQTVKLSCRVQDQQGRASDTAQVSCTIVPAGGGPAGGAAQPPETVPLAAGRGAGIFEAAYRPTREGTFRVKAAAFDAAGASLGTDELTLIVAPFSAETDRLARDDTTLQMIADQSRGRYADVFALPDVIRQLAEGRQDRLAQQPQGEIIRLDNFPVLFLLFVALLTGEWLLRRTWQLH